MLTRSIQCQPAVAKVTFTVVTLEFSGIGYSQRIQQHDVSCSAEQECQHARLAYCPAQRLQDRLDNS